MLRQVSEGEAGLLAFVPVEKLERLEVAEKLEAGALPVRQRVEVRAGLLTRGRQVAPGALLLDQQDAGPEQIDVAGGVVEPLDAFLVPRHVAAALAEDLEEVVVEALGLALLVRGVGPFTGEAGGPRADLVPRKPHRRRQSVGVSPSAVAVAPRPPRVASACASIGDSVSRSAVGSGSREPPIRRRVKPLARLLHSVPAFQVTRRLPGRSGHLWPQAGLRPETDRAAHFPGA